MKNAKKNSDFQSGWGIHSYTYSNLYQFLIRVGKKMMNHTTTKTEKITERETVKSSVMYKFRFSTMCGRRFWLTIRSGKLAGERYKAKREVVLTF